MEKKATKYQWSDNNEEFRFSSIVWHELYQKLSSLDDCFENLLNKHFHLSSYSKEVKHIDFVFIANIPEYNIHEEETSYSSKKQILTLSLALDYDRFAQANPQEAKEMMAELYLEAIKTYPTIRGMKKVQFDYEKFYVDVKDLFEREGWLKKFEMV